MTPTLFHAPLACSLAARFAAAEGDVAVAIEPVNLASKELASGGSLFDLNPLGQVSVLRLSDSELLTETGVVMLWLQTQSSNNSFRIDPGDPRYFALLRWLSFCATELHKQLFRVVFYPEATDEVKDRVRALAPQRFEVLEALLAQQEFLLGEQFSAADCYLAWFFVLAGRAQVEPSGFPNLYRYQEQVLKRPKIADLIAEDLAAANIQRG